jgi:hypothetical protein
MRLAAAVKWLEMGLISQGRAAEIAGLSRSELVPNGLRDQDMAEENREDLLMVDEDKIIQGRGVRDDRPRSLRRSRSLRSCSKSSSV